MVTESIPLSHLEKNLLKTLTEVLDTGKPVIVELPDHRLLRFAPLGPAAEEDEGFMSDLVESNPKFRALLEKSLAGGRKPFPLGE